MAIGFPTNTALLTILSMGGMAAVLWFSLSQALERLPFKPAVKRGWRWAVAGVLIAWFTIRVGLAFFPPGGTVLGAPYVVGFVTLGLTFGLTPLVLSSTF